MPVWFKWLVNQILDHLGQILYLLGVIKAQQADLADEATALAIQGIANSTDIVVHDPDHGNNALKNFLEVIQAQPGNTLATILDAIANLPVYELPPDPPVDWPTVNTNNLLATLIDSPWFGAVLATQTVQTVLTNADVHGVAKLGAEGAADRRNPWFAWVDICPDLWWANMRPQENPYRKDCPVATDWSEWDGAESLADLLNRIHPEWSWSATAPEAWACPGIVFGTATGFGGARWRCLVRECDLPLVSGRLWALLSDLGAARPPVWPGLAGVTLGTPVALAQGVDVIGPLHGVLLDITSTDRVMPFQQTGAFMTYRNTGRFSFYNDDGWAEDWGGIPSNHAQLMPRQMAIAGGCQLAFYCGVTGWATPFTIGGA